MSESAHASAPAEPPDRPRDELASLAGQFRHAATGVQARLRRVNPCRDGRGAVFETELLLHGARLQPRDDEDRRRWALVLHCLALADGTDLLAGATLTDTLMRVPLPLGWLLNLPPHWLKYIT